MFFDVKMKDVEIVMNTIPSIFNENQINCTVFGGTEESTDATLDMSVILLK